MTITGRQASLGVLVAVAVGLAGYQLWPRASAAPAAAGQAAGGSRVERAIPSQPAVPAVHLRALDEPRPRPLAVDRNLFRFKPRPAPPPPVAPPVVAAPPPGPPPPPPAPRLPPITYRFIGIVEAPDRAERLAVLTDGQNRFYGREGQLIEGRYRILRIGPDSIEMAYADGRGRQTIRLTGS
jgi:hypothetical protein